VSAATRHAALVLVAVVVLIAAYGPGLTLGGHGRQDPHARVVDKVALTVKELHHGPIHSLSRVHP